MLMNEKIGHANFSSLANYSQPSYAAQHVTKVKVASVKSAPYVNMNSYNSAPNVIDNPNRINKNSVTSHTPSYGSAA